MTMLLWMREPSTYALDGALILCARVTLSTQLTSSFGFGFPPEKLEIPPKTTIIRPFLGEDPYLLLQLFSVAHIAPVPSGISEDVTQIENQKFQSSKFYQ